MAMQVRGLRKGRARLMFRLMVFSVSLAALVLSGCGSATPTDSKAPAAAPKATAQPFVVGAMFDITGSSSSLGIPYRDTVTMLQDQINATGGVNGTPLKVILYDTESDQTKAVLVAKKLIETDGVQVIVGPGTSPPTLAAIPVFQEKNIPAISLGASSQITQPIQDRKWMFKTPQSDRLVFEAMMQYFGDQKLTKVGFIGDNTAYGDSARTELERLAPAAGVKVVAVERFDRNDRDMTAQLTRLRRENPDAIIVWTVPPASAVVQRNIFDMGFKIPVLHGHGNVNQEFLTVGGPAVEGVILPSSRLAVSDILPDSDPQKAVITKFKQDFKAKYGRDPDNFGAYSRDALMMVVEGYKQGARKSAEFRDYLEKLKGFVGVTGTFNYSAQDHDGLDLTSVVMIKVKDGKWAFHQSIKKPQ